VPAGAGSSGGGGGSADPSAAALLGQRPQSPGGGGGGDTSPRNMPKWASKLASKAQKGLHKLRESLND
jgi:hypothetical protein